MTPSSGGSPFPSPSPGVHLGELLPSQLSLVSLSRGSTSLSPSPGVLHLGDLLLSALPLVSSIWGIFSQPFPWCPPSGESSSLTPVLLSSIWRISSSQPFLCVLHLEDLLHSFLVVSSIWGISFSQQYPWCLPYEGSSRLSSSTGVLHLDDLLPSVLTLVFCFCMISPTQPIPWCPPSGGSSLSPCPGVLHLENLLSAVPLVSSIWRISFSQLFPSVLHLGYLLFPSFPLVSSIWRIFPTHFFWCPPSGVCPFPGPSPGVIHMKDLLLLGSSPSGESPSALSSLRTCCPSGAFPSPSLFT